MNKSPPFEPPKLQLALSAREELKASIAQVPDMRPVVWLFWAVGVQVQALGSSEREVLPPHWRAGFYDVDDIPKGLTIVHIDGIPFLFGGQSDLLLDGGTLHFSEGGFRVERSAI